MKWKDTHPRPSPPDYRTLNRERLQLSPAITLPAVVRGGIATIVRCCCGREFEYLQDQVNCPQCGRFFDKSEAEDLTVEVRRTQVGKTQFLIDFMDKSGWLEEHMFTFPDGDTWEASSLERS